MLDPRLFKGSPGSDVKGPPLSIESIDDKNFTLKETQLLFLIMWWFEDVFCCNH
jgi:hypothetical protein